MGIRIAALGLLLWVVAPLQARDEWLAAFTARVLREGHEASLPPHLSLVLGLGSGESPLPVRQFGFRTGETVHTFNVASDKGKRVTVLLEYDEGTRVTRAFLIRRGGTLEKAVNYEAGAQPDALTGESARSLFRQQMSLWRARATG